MGNGGQGWNRQMLICSKSYDALLTLSKIYSDFTRGEVTRLRYAPSNQLEDYPYMLWLVLPISVREIVVKRLGLTMTNYPGKRYYLLDL